MASASSTIPYSVSTPYVGPVIMPHVTMIDIITGPYGMLGYYVKLVIDSTTFKTY